jgi:hypothetical protein
MRRSSPRPTRSWSSNGSCTARRHSSPPPTGPSSPPCRTDSPRCAPPGPAAGTPRDRTALTPRPDRPGITLASVARSVSADHQRSVDPAATPLWTRTSRRDRNDPGPRPVGGGPVQSHRVVVEHKYACGGGRAVDPAAAASAGQSAGTAACRYRGEAQPSGAHRIGRQQAGPTPTPIAAARSCWSGWPTSTRRTSRAPPDRHRPLPQAHSVGCHRARLCRPHCHAVYRATCGRRSLGNLERVIVDVAVEREHP